MGTKEKYIVGGEIKQLYPAKEEKKKFVKKPEQKKYVAVEESKSYKGKEQDYEDFEESDSENELVEKLNQANKSKKVDNNRKNSDGEGKVYLKKFRERID